MCGAPLPYTYQFAVARFCHESMAVEQSDFSARSAISVSTQSGPGLPENALDQSRYPHQFDSRDDGRIDTQIEFSLSETFRSLETAYQLGQIAETDYPSILEEASKLYFQLQ